MAGIPSQQFVTIEAIRDGVVILKDGSLRAILMCSSINFALKSTDEQDAIIFQFQDFLNSLDFPLQFSIHSRHLNITPHLDTLRSRQKEEENELLKIQIGEYIEFIKTFVEMTHVMSKTFYAIIPFSATIAEKTGVFSTLRSTVLMQKTPPVDPQTPGTFEESQNQLWIRVETVTAGLRPLGIRSAPLKTEELIELFYGLYNPTEFEKLVRTEQASE